MTSISPGPYRWAVINEGPNQMQHVRDYFKFGNGPIHAVYLPQHSGTVVGENPDSPEHAILMCITGNGPNSENNAKGIIEVLESYAATIKENTRLREENQRLDKTIRAIENLEEKADAASWQEQCEMARESQLKAMKERDEACAKIRELNERLT